MPPLGTQIIENPDETFMMQLYSPGVQPTFGGDLWARVLIADDGDGGVGSRGYLEKLYADDTPDTAALFGYEVVLGGGGNFALVGAPHIAVGGVSNAGRVRTYVRSAGFWIRTGWLDLPPADVAINAEFGASVAIERQTANVAVVSAPGTSRVYIFQRTGNNWSLAANFTPSTLALAAVPHISHVAARMLLCAPA